MIAGSAKNEGGSGRPARCAGFEELERQAYAGIEWKQPGHDRSHARRRHERRGWSRTSIVTEADVAIDGCAVSAVRLVLVDAFERARTEERDERHNGQQTDAERAAHRTECYTITKRTGMLMSDPGLRVTDNFRKVPDPS